jgi:predicted PurR-regulated permease PerM
VTGATSRKPAGVAFKWFVAVAAVGVVASLVWGLRSLIVPVFVGGLLAYICRPLVTGLERFRIPRSLAAALLLVTFAALALVGFHSVRAAVPTEIEVLELRVRALHALNHRYQALMGLDASWTHGNRLYWLAHPDLDPLVDRASELLALTPDERAQLVASLDRRSAAASAPSNRLIDYDRYNAQAARMRVRPTGGADANPKASGGSPPTGAPGSIAQSGLPPLGDVLSSWMIAPLVFLFLLWDTGALKRGLLSAIPNWLFEPALTVLTDVDRALGNYVRGIFLECCALGLTVAVFITIVGVPLRWALSIGIFTGASNVVPYMGFAAALLGGVAYALLAENVRPLIPLVTVETFAIWVIVAVTLAELLKNVVYEPIVLGGALKLHPLAVVIGVVGGAILFGPAGMFLAIPTITVVKALFVSSGRHLKAYGLI